MEERPRKPGTTQYAENFSDEQFIEAVKEITKIPTATAPEVAEKVGCSKKTAIMRLKKLVNEGVLDSDFRGAAWHFNLK
jgi:hypothetical protein